MINLNYVMSFKEYKEEIKYWHKSHPPINKLVKPHNVVLDIVIGCFYSGVGRLGVNKGIKVKGVLGWNSEFKTFHLTNKGNKHSITPVDIRTLNTL